MMAHTQQLCSTQPIPSMHEQIALQCAKNICTAAMNMAPQKSKNGALPVLVEVQRMNDNKCYRYVVNMSQGTVTMVGESAMTEKPPCPMHGNASMHEDSQHEQLQQIVLCDQLACEENDKAMAMADTTSHNLCIAQKSVHVVNDSAWEDPPGESTLDQRFATFEGPAFLLQASEVCGQIAAALEQDHCSSNEDHSARSITDSNGLKDPNGLNGLNGQNGSNDLKRLNGFNGYKQPPKENKYEHKLPNGIHRMNYMNGPAHLQLMPNAVPVSEELSQPGPLQGSEIISTPRDRRLSNHPMSRPLPMPRALAMQRPLKMRRPLLMRRPLPLALTRPPPGRDTMPHIPARKNLGAQMKNEQTDNMRGIYPTHRRYPPELQKQFMWNCCNLCRTSMRTVHNACEHYTSRSHDRRIGTWLVQDRIKRIKTTEDQMRNSSTAGPTAFYCDVCDLKLSSMMIAQQHFFGRRHQQVSRYKTKPGGPGFFDKHGCWVGADVKRLTCELCDVKITSQSQMAMHQAGARHRKKLRTGLIGGNKPVEGSHMYRITPDGLLAPLNPLGMYMCEAFGNAALRKAFEMSANFFCEVCNITLNHLKSVKQHEEGRMHKKKIMRSAFLTNLNFSDS